MEKDVLSLRWNRLLFIVAVLLYTNLATSNPLLETNVFTSEEPICNTDTIVAKELFDQAEAYYEGKNGLFMNRDKAKELYIKAAEMNYAPAQFEIFMKWKTSDCETAIKYLEKAAEQKYFPALENMFLEYSEPEAPCINVDNEKALYWGRIGAELGDDILQFMLGVYYYNQEPMDEEQAEYWLGMQAVKGYAPAQMIYGKVITRIGHRTHNANKEAEGLSWIEKAALQGESEAMLILGITYKYIKNNLPEAVKWFKKGSDVGNADCMLEYAGLLRDGKGVKKDTKAAFSYFLKAAELGKPEAMRFVAAGYWLGEGVKKDREESLRWHRRAAENGDQQSMEFLNSYYK